MNIKGRWKDWKVGKSLCSALVLTSKDNREAADDDKDQDDDSHQADLQDLGQIGQPQLQLFRALTHFRYSYIN